MLILATFSDNDLSGVLCTGALFLFGLLALAVNHQAQKREFRRQQQELMERKNTRP